MNQNSTARLLIAAGVLMLTAGCIFCFIQQWISVALLWISAFSCLIAALCFKNSIKDKHSI